MSFCKHTRSPPHLILCTSAPCGSVRARSLIKFIEPVPLDEDGQPLHDPSRATAKELSELVETLADTQVGKCVRVHACPGAGARMPMCVCMCVCVHVCAVRILA